MIQLSVLEETSPINAEVSMASYEERISSAHNHFSREEYNQALAIFQQLMEDRSSEQTDSQRTALLYKCGISYLMLNQYDAALDNLHESAEASKKYNLTDRFIDSWKYIGLTHYRMGDFRTALEYYNDVLELLDEEEKIDQYRGLLCMIGATKSELGDSRGH